LNCTLRTASFPSKPTSETRFSHLIQQAAKTPQPQKEGEKYKNKEKKEIQWKPQYEQARSIAAEKNSRTG
jgi:hypothetical protein